MTRYFSVITGSPYWQGAGGLWKGLLQLVWVGVRFWLAQQLWDTAVHLAQYPPPTKNLGVVAAVIVLLLIIWGLWGLLKAFTILGLRRLLLTIVVVYLLFLFINVLTVPDERPLASRVKDQAGQTGVSMGKTAVSAIQNLFTAPDEFLFAYTGLRSMPDLPPGFPTPDPHATPIRMESSAGDQPQRSLRPTPTITTMATVEPR